MKILVASIRLSTIIICPSVYIFQVLDNVVSLLSFDNYHNYPLTTLDQCCSVFGSELESVHCKKAYPAALALLVS